MQKQACYIIIITHVQVSLDLLLNTPANVITSFLGIDVCV